MLALSQTATTPNSELFDACGADPGQFCEWVYKATDSAGFASFVDWVTKAPLRIVLILVAAFVSARLLKRAISHFGERLAEEEPSEAVQALRRGRAGRLIGDEAADARAKARTETLTSVLGSVAGLVVWTIAGLLLLGEIGISLAPLLAGAGVAGVAIGFGAQTIVRDFLAGFFMLVEDQYGVGDVIDVGEMSGTVERMSMRTTVLRDVNGNVWHVPNGEITRVANMSQLWSRAVLDIDVAYDTDIGLAEGVIQRVADELWRDPTFQRGDIIDPPEVWGVENFGADGITLRLVVKTDPAEQWIVARELRRRIKEAFDDAGIEIPYPQRTVWTNEDPRPPKPDPSVVPVSPVRRSKNGDDGLPDTNVLEK